jgi:uncharacterized protein YcbK (DUF882 family)
MAPWHLHACPCCAKDEEEAPALGRRGLLAAAVGIGAAAALRSRPVLAADGAPRALSVRRYFTGDSFSGVYWRDGHYDREALRQLDVVFRDLSAAEATPMDPRLFDVLHDVAQRLDTTEPYEVISGYRAPETNAARARASRNVSRVSLHMSGMAADVRIPGRDSVGLARTAGAMQLGGVGLYRRDGFVHLDCGPTRRW